MASAKNLLAERDQTLHDVKSDFSEKRVQAIQEWIDWANNVKFEDDDVFISKDSTVSHPQGP